MEAEPKVKGQVNTGTDWLLGLWVVERRDLTDGKGELR